ncbi:MAG: hypothetical protein ACYDEY_12915 [Acidimicrobiales bacterium]
MVVDLLEHFEGLVTRDPKTRAQIPEGTSELFEDLLWSGVWPEGIDGLFDGGALGSSQVPGEQHLRA